MSAYESEGERAEGRKLGLYGKDTCPRCGAPRSVQKYPIRRATDLAAMELVDNLHPSDGVVCRKCGFEFRVSALDVDGDYLVSQDELECIPNYCPRCGEILAGETCRNADEKIGASLANLFGILAGRDTETKPNDAGE